MIRKTRWCALALLCAMLAGLAPMTARPHTVIAQQVELDEDVYEPDDGPEQAHPLLPTGIPQPHTFHTGSDVDWVYLDLNEGDRVEVSTAGDCDTFLTVVAPDGRTPLAQDDDSGGGGNALVRFTAPIEATFFVQVRLFGRPEHGCGPYLLSAVTVDPPEPDAYEPDDSPAQAKPLPTDGSLQQHSFHVAGDQDWLSLAIQPNTAFRIATVGACDTVLTLYAPDGHTVLAEDDDSGQNGNSVIVQTFLQGGTYFLLVKAYDETVDVCDSYSVSATSVPPSFPDAYEPDDTPQQARPLPLDGTPQERTLHAADDVDWVSIFLSAGDRLFIWTSGACDTYLFMVGPDGRTILDENDDGGEDANAALLFSAKQGGLYYAVVRPFGGSTPTCDSYQLQAILVPPAKVPAGSTPTPVRTPTAPAPAGTTTVTPPVVTPTMTPPRSTVTPTRVPTGTIR